MRTVRRTLKESLGIRKKRLEQGLGRKLTLLEKVKLTRGQAKKIRDARAEAGLNPEKNYGGRTGKTRLERAKKALRINIDSGFDNKKMVRALRDQDARALTRARKLRAEAAKARTLRKNSKAERLIRRAKRIEQHIGWERKN